MSMEKEDIGRLAELSKIEISESELPAYLHDIQSIVHMIDQLNEIDFEDLADAIDTEQKNAFREDVVCQTIAREELLRGAPKIEAGGFSVPKVVE